MRFELKYGDNYVSITDFEYSAEDKKTGNPYNTMFYINVVSGYFSGSVDWECDIKDFLYFVEELDKMYQFKVNRAELSDIGNENKITFNMDKMGHIEIKGKINEHASLHTLEFEFTADQSSLNHFVDNLKGVYGIVNGTNENFDKKHIQKQSGNKHLDADFLLKADSCGWSEFKLGNFETSVSEISNFPIDCVNGFIQAMNNKLPVSIGFDEEGHEFTLLLDYYDRVCLISYDNDRTRIYKYTIPHRKLADIFLTDMARDFDKYVDDDLFFRGLYIDGEPWKTVFYNKLNELERLVKNYRG